jgi:hypothetical protein
MARATRSSVKAQTEELLDSKTEPKPGTDYDVIVDGRSYSAGDVTYSIVEATPPLCSASLRGS